MSNITDDQSTYLEWCDGHPQIFDSTVMFTRGYDFDWMTASSEWAQGHLGRFHIWSDGPGRDFRVYDEVDGGFTAVPLASRAEAVATAERWNASWQADEPTT